MTDNIEDQIARFRERVDRAAVIDLPGMAQEAHALVDRIVRAHSHTFAAAQLRDFHDAHQDSPEYVTAGIVAALTELSLLTLLVAPMDAVGGPDGLLARLHRLAHAARALGVTLDGVR